MRIFAFALFFLAVWPLYAQQELEEEQDVPTEEEFAQEDAGTGTGIGTLDDVFYQIVGIKLKLGINAPIHRLRGRGVNSDDGNVNRIQPASNFPFSLVFPENVFGDIFYGQFFADFEWPFRGKNLAPNSHKPRLRSEFLTESDLSKCSFDDDSSCEITADFRVWHVGAGYLLGVFYPIDDNHRILKFGVGLGAGYVNYQIDLFICDRYEITGKFDGSSNLIISGDCFGKKKIDDSHVIEPAWAAGGHIAFYEYISESFALTLIEIENVSVIKETKFKSHPQLDFTTTGNSGNLFTLTYFF